MRALSLILVGFLSLGTALAEPSAWELRGDTFLQAGKLQRALLAYETALAANPDDSAVLSKYQKTFLLVLSEQKVEAEAGRDTGHLNRMGARQPSPTPTPTPTPEEVPAGESDEAADPGATAKAGDPAAKSAGKATDKAGAATDAEEGAEDPADTIRVREDGTIELRFGRLNRMGARPSRMGATGGTAGVEEEPEEEKPPEPAVFGGGQNVSVSQPKLGFEGSQGDEVAPENTVIQTTKYRIENVTLAYRSRALEIQGKLTNVSGKLIKLPRVYVSIFDEAGVLRGRNFGYIYPGRNLLARGATKGFKVDFRGYTDPVASYRIEVIP